MFLLSLLACSDYAINGKDDAPPGDTDSPAPTGAPIAQVSPSILDLGVVCGVSGGAVNLSNVGDAPLTVTAAEVVAGAWTVGGATLPATVEPGGTLSFGLSGEGVGTLRISTDDPVAPTIEVPLSSTADAPPLVQILSPTTNAVLPVSGDVSFTALVTDDVDAPTTIPVSWESSVDGPLSSAVADASGIAAYAWTTTARSAGLHTVIATATDSCGQSAAHSVEVCQDMGYSEASVDLASWHFEGNARWDSANTWVELTTNGGNQAGTAFQTGATASSDNVVISFRFYVSGGSGADGISLTALDTTRMTSFVGSTGGGIGYAGLPGWSLEIDTWYNSELNDPTADDHASFHINGDTTNYVAWSTLPEMEDGAWHDAEITVVGSNVKLVIDGVTYIDQAVTGITSFPAYVGFTAATGGATNYHLIDALEVTRYACE